jgi:hypothetical protein
MPDGSFSNLVQSLASPERRETDYLGTRVARLEELLDDGKRLSLEEQIEAAWTARSVARRAASWGVSVKSNSWRVVRLLDAFE